MKQKKSQQTDFQGVSKMPFCTISSDYMTWNHTGSWRYLQPRYVEQIPACQAACPTANDIEAWIGLMEEGKINEAWEKAVLENPFPGIMGRVCFHPCEGGCNRKHLGGTVSIKMLERVLADKIGSNAPIPKPFAPASKKKIAVIGSGPAGLACAYHLTRLGHTSHIIERQAKAGGLLRFGIPEYRLPKAILDAEIERLKKMGIEFRLGRAVRDAAEMQMLCQEYDAVFIAAGAHKSKNLGVPNEHVNGVMYGLAFLEQVIAGKTTPIGKKVLVVGGGNTAIDSARSAKRLGSEVTIIYRRSRGEMPAFDEEIEQAELEGVKIEYLTIPKNIFIHDGRAAGLICDKAELGEIDESGRFKPVPIEGSEFTIYADSIICAIGEGVETSLIPSTLPIQGGALGTGLGGKTGWTNLFAGGDFTNPQRTVVDALGSGKISAIAIDCHFRDINFGSVFDKISIPGSNIVRMRDYISHIYKTSEKLISKRNIVYFEHLNHFYFYKSEPNIYPMRPLEERFGHNRFQEVQCAPQEDVVKDELSRCFHCGRCNLCDNCYIYCPDAAIMKAGKGYDLDLAYCKGCGVCAHECPRAAIDLIEEPLEF